MKPIGLRIESTYEFLSDIDPYKALTFAEEHGLIKFALDQSEKVSSFKENLTRKRTISMLTPAENNKVLNELELIEKNTSYPLKEFFGHVSSMRYFKPSILN